MKKRNVIIIAITLALALTACAPKEAVDEETVATQDTTPTETQMVETEPTVEETVAPTEAATEPEKTVPQVTTAPALNTGNYTNSNTASKPSSSTNTNTNNSNGNSSGTTTVTPSVTEPATAETPAVTPTPTPTPAEPEVTEPIPAATEAPVEPKPTEHTHSWQEVCHEAESHEVVWYVCQCGARFDSSNFAGLQSHCTSFSGTEVLNHTGYGTVSETVVDTPAYSTWVCSCGATSNTQP